MVHADLDRVLAWRNHPNVRGNMFSQHEISMDEHQRWFELNLLDPKKHLLIFEVKQQPLGVVNFNEAGNDGVAEWGFYVAPDAPKGSGRKLGRAALNHAFTNLKLNKVCGQALGYNIRSIKFHKSLGFQQEAILLDKYFDGERFYQVICFGLLFKEWQPRK